MAEQPAPAKCVAESRVQLSMIMNPEHANPFGNVHGGVIMKLADEAGALAAMRHASSYVVTVAIDRMSFDEPILVGNVVMLAAELTYAGRTSMEVRVTVTAEDPFTGRRVPTNVAYIVYVAIDREGRPRPVPPLCLETPEEELRFEQAKERQEERTRHRQREEILREHAARRDAEP